MKSKFRKRTPRPVTEQTLSNYLTEVVTTETVMTSNIAYELRLCWAEIDRLEKVVDSRGWDEGSD